ncbi:MAG: serine/threonine protein kinase [Eubacterium sp.]|nr:serine/threonine protein kinase [Eubacterium sp.]
METGSEWKGWIVEENLGKGSFGQVYRITRKDFGYTYASALKVIRIPRDDFEVEALRRDGMSEEDITSYFYGMVEDITSEIVLMSQLKGHSNIVSYEDHMVEKLQDEFGWEIYLRMELLTPLYKYLSENVLTAAGVVRLGIDMAGALEACESNNILHRDIKPDNIFHSRQGTFKLGDFGIARKMEKVYAGFSRKGTFTYMAPEVYQGKSYDQTADIYSLGLVLYRFLNDNRGPFQQERAYPMAYSEAEEATMRRMTGEALPAPEKADDRLSEIILKACAYDPADRYQSAAELRKDLIDILDSQDDAAPVIPLFPSDGNTVTMFSSFDESEVIDRSKSVKDIHESSPAAEVYKPQKRAKSTSGRRNIVIAGAAFAVLISALLAFLLLFARVPDVTGLSYEAAEKEIEKAGFKVEESGRSFSYDIERGHVITQTSDGERLRKGSVVYVTISRGKAIEAPDLTGKKESTARSEAEREKLTVEVASSEYSQDVAKGRVISQDPAAGTECEEGQTISIVKSKGPEQVEVPDLSGMAEKKARKTLEDLKFGTKVSYSYSSETAAGKVVSQKPAKGDKADKGSKVSVVVSKGPQPASSTRNYSRSTGTKKSKSGSSKSKKSSSAKHGKGTKL